MIGVIWHIKHLLHGFVAVILFYISNNSLVQALVIIAKGKAHILFKLLSSK